MNPIEILWHDAWILALNKPSGIPSAVTRDPKRPTLYHEAKHIAGREVWVVHRLDLGTSGVIVLARDSEMAHALSKAFEERKIQKLYWALCSNLPQGLNAEEALYFEDRSELMRWAIQLSRQALCYHECEGAWLHLSAPMRPSQTRKRLWSVTRSGGKPAHTRFRVLASAPGLHLIGARPQTGRTHQIRVHLAHLQAPILGDQEYGGARAPRLMLHARALEFDHPITHQPLTIKASCDFK